MTTENRPDAGVRRVIAAFGVPTDALLGFGGEAWVFAEGARRVLRIYHAETARSTVDRRTQLLGVLAASAGAVPFFIPTVLETLEVEGRIVTREERLAGRPATTVLGETSGAARAELVRRYLDAAAAIGDLAIGRATYGDLTRDDPIETPVFRDYLEQRAARSLAGAGRDFARVSAVELARAWPEPAAPAFVHLDAFPGNMLADAGRITAVIDFGGVSLAGDRRIDPLAAAAYLTPDITPTASRADREVAADWLAARGLGELYPVARRWIAAYWSAARDDVRLHTWCRSVLL